MLKREELTAERIAEIVADARKAGYDFFLTAEEREASLKEALARYAPGDEAWIFAYGSLMWNPAIEFAEQQPCLVEGWRRSFCFWLPIGRGTPELPGLMLALERGGSLRRHRLSPGARAGAQRTRHPVEPRDAGGRLQALLDSGQAARRPHRHRRHLRGRHRPLPVLRRPADRAHGASHRLRRGPPRRLPRLPCQHRRPCARAQHPRSLYRGAGRAGGAACAARTSSRPFRQSTAWPCRLARP